MSIRAGAGAGMGSSVPVPEAGDGGKLLSVTGSEDGYELVPAPSGAGAVLPLAEAGAYAYYALPVTVLAATNLPASSVDGDTEGGQWYAAPAGTPLTIAGLDGVSSLDTSDSPIPADDYVLWYGTALVDETLVIPVPEGFVPKVTESAASAAVRATGTALADYTAISTTGVATPTIENQTGGFSVGVSDDMVVPADGIYLVVLSANNSGDDEADALLQASVQPNNNTMTFADFESGGTTAEVPAGVHQASTSIVLPLAAGDGWTFGAGGGITQGQLNFNWSATKVADLPTYV